ncbi:MAG: hypothetical protein JW800_00250 [Candidatus Omnitrophica bacterium]|nr:hypothetical protein [Candidatus Omnitrophota bacterium]
MQKVRYELDPHNRLIIDRSGNKSDLTKFRKILDGRFKLDRNNELSYHIKAPLSRRETIPHQVKLRGTWSLTDNHDLRLTLDKQGRETFGDQLTLQGEILDAGRSSLLFALTTKTKDNTQSTYILDFKGSWRADENNRLSFHVKREEGRHDILTFNGVWEMGKNHQVIYRYEKAGLIRKKSKTHTLTFKGHWDIKDKGRISYALARGTDSVFEFKTSAGVFKEGYIKYELGIGLAGRKEPIKKTVTLFGRWSIKKDVGLVFEAEYEDGRTRAIVFGADAKLTDRDTVSFRLKNDKERKDIGADLELSHKILKGDGQAFLKALRSKQESAIYAGAGWRW